ncbi:MAG: phosphoenolpyruvate--protein phosphotransferase [Deltaproteobacteria bacterium]|nr:phosphoenolpyruvate--protein phosphotransferase [Deltaproteobacteria bacterium]MBW2601341.1 phosphoenolpyruvate--protein phosphotransferase [Deltaproteobacteria bacterium]
MFGSTTNNLVFNGIGASAGIAVGKAYLLEREDSQVIEKRFLEPEEIGPEINRFREAAQKAGEHLREIIREIPDEYKDQSYILDAHMMILKDRLFHDGTIEEIKKRSINAEQALKIITDKATANFKKMPDPYFQERRADIIHVSNLILKNLLGTSHSPVANIDKRVIIVAHDLSPVDTTQIQLEKVKALITEVGSPTSHTGIIARSLEIPAVLGLENATESIKTGDLIIVDGSTGVVIIDPDKETLAKYYKRKERLEAFQAQITRTSHLPAETTDGHRIAITANITVLEEIVSVIDHGGEGIGLYRTEFLYLSQSTLPSEEDLFDNYKDLAELMGERKVTIRTLDIGGDKFASSIQWADEMNPALGVRGIRFCLQSPKIFRAQLRAILRAARFGNIRIMFPMISQVEEVVQAKQMLDKAAESLDKEGIPFKRDIQIGAMIEVPSAVFMADILAGEVDFFSLGTNDLIQYSFAIDRVNKHVADLYQPLHPTVLRMIHHVVEAGRTAGIPVALCGEMGGDAINLPVLLGLELDSISMNPVSIPAIKEAIRRLSFEDSKILAQKAMKECCATDVRDLVFETCGKSFEMATFFQSNGA